MRLPATHYKPTATAIAEHIEDSGIRHNVVVELNDCIEQAFYAIQRPLAMSTQYPCPHIPHAHTHLQEEPTCCFVVGHIRLRSGSGLFLVNAPQIRIITSIQII